MGRAKKNVEVEAQVIARGNVVPMMTEIGECGDSPVCFRRGAAREDRLVSEIPDDYGTDETGRPVQLNRDRPASTEAKAMVKRWNVGNVA